MIFDWPHPALSPRITDLRLINRTRSAGESITGFEQVAYGVTQRWALSLEFNNLKREAILPYRALLASLQGRANAVRVPIRDEWLWPADDAIGIMNVPSRSDPWRMVDDGEAVEDVAAFISGSTGGKSATVDFSAVNEPELAIYPGMYFGAGDDLHIIALDGLSWSGSTATITFEPGFRRAREGSPFRLRPTLTCRLATDETGRHPMEHGRKTSPSLELVEILPDELALVEGGG